MSKEQIAIIPARGGSKRLPRKNILPIGGQPIISYPIRAALLSGEFHDVVVSTEDSEISEVAAGFGATVVARPDQLSEDHSSVVDVCTHVLSLSDYLATERFCCIYATAAFLEPGDISGARELMDSEPKADYVMGVSTYNYHPVQALKEERGYLSYMWPEYKERKSQEYPELVVSNGTLYWADAKSFLKEQTFYGRRLKGYQLSTVDIDTQADYEKAQRIAVNYNYGDSKGDGSL